MNTPIMKRPRLSDEIAEKIKNLIFEGAWVRGQRLPAERELAESFGVSRPSVREAIHSLVAMGLLQTQHGGGTYVADEVGAIFRDPLQNVLLANADAQRDLLEFRHMVEGACSYYAALRATEADKERLSKAFSVLKQHYEQPHSANEQQHQDADAHFHLVIAEASHNAVLLHTIRNTYEVLGPEVRINFGGVQEGQNIRDDLIAQHQALYEAIMQGSADNALLAAQGHIRYIQDVLVEKAEMQQREARAKRRLVSF
ncbi:FadR/GntR family transcriptional regulator [Paenalcaligenes sp. Me131]|uniref:FadR/GntR family transcriptional regulator n=1 Tax=Paenalcaligenes sp. Me131 TaxID=3392636 RepID=UPI003D2E7F67